MKKLLFIIVLFSVFATVKGQEEKTSNLKTRKYVVKFQPVNYALNSYSFEVERMLNRKNAVTIGVGIPKSGSLLGKYGIEATNDLSKLDLSTMHARLAYRHYGGNSGLPRGFYIEPYLKYQQFKADATINIENDNSTMGMLKSLPIRSAVMATNTTSPADIKADFNTINVGFQMGVQMMIAKFIAIDFYFLGIEAGMVNGTLTGTPSDATKITEMRDKIDDGIDDLPGFLKDKLTVTNNSSSVTVKAKQLPYPWLRAGINIGIAF